MSVNQQQFGVILAQLGTTIVGEDAVIVQALSASDAVIAKLVAALGSQGNNVDLTTEAEAVQSMIADATTQTSRLADEVAKLNA